MPALQWKKCVSGRLVACLGEIEVGAVIDDWGGAGKAAWIDWLPPAYGHQWRQEKSHDAACLALEFKVSGWLRRAGLAVTEARPTPRSEPMRAAVPQEAPSGLFDDAARAQLDLVEACKQS